MSEYSDRECPEYSETITGDDKNCPNCDARVGRGGSYNGYIKKEGIWFRPAGSN